jgi:hypothetical protein
LVEFTRVFKGFWRLRHEIIAAVLHLLGIEATQLQSVTLGGLVYTNSQL